MTDAIRQEFTTSMPWTIMAVRGVEYNAQYFNAWKACAEIANLRKEVLTLRTKAVERKAWAHDVDRDYKSDHGEYFHGSCGICQSPFYGGKGRGICAVCLPTGEVLKRLREIEAAARALIDAICYPALSKDTNAIVGDLAALLADAERAR